MRVLIVDDATFMRASIKSILEKNNYEVVGEADNGLSAISKYKDLRPDIVTMDITMPEMSGIDALKEIRKIDPNCKVVMVSAVGQEMYIREAVMNGAKDFIIKPFKDTIVIEKLNKLVVNAKT